MRSVSEPADRRQHILVIDDDEGIRALLTELLVENGYDAVGVADGVELERVLCERAVDLLVLDVMLAEECGLFLCEAIRARSQVPIILLSACSEESHRVAGLDRGADDFLAKPFGRSELLARVRAVLRRTRSPHLPQDVPKPEVLMFAGWHYRPRYRELLAPSGAEIELTAAEHELLLCLLRNPRRLISRQQLRAWPRRHSDIEADVLIGRLRRKMRDGQRTHPLIRPVRNVGYMLAADVSAR